ncbi:MAG: hypothetical protein VYD19_07435 [Myxococcota bacterium]|nr:hypothetical protein [Myxococcota bacterium]
MAEPKTNPNIPEDLILNALIQGCDERIYLRTENNRNKYHLNPLQYEDLLQRGSCTANVLTPSAIEVAKDFLSKYDALSYESLLESQSQRLRELVQSEYKDPFDVFFAPSGSDLVYYPLMFQRLLNPDRRILNIVSCSQELGSGSLFASEGKFYGDYNQFGEAIPKGQLIDPAREVDVHYLNARSESGAILDRTMKIKQLISENPEASVVGSLVFGSKSGIKDDLQIIDEDDETMWVVDLCQFRVDRSLIHTLLEKGVMVMLTGSKFFQTPPFCAALLVSRKWTERLRAVKDCAVVAPFGRLLSAYDLPWHLERLRAELPNRENKGLRLRWAIALDEMEAYSAWSFEETEGVINNWSETVMAKIEASPFFRLMPDQRKTNASIISFQVWMGGLPLEHQELKRLFEDVCLSEHEGFAGNVRRVFIGQPVTYGEKSFIRVAIGAYSIRRFLEKGEVDLADDARLLEVIEHSAEKLFGG